MTAVKVLTRCGIFLLTLLPVWGYAQCETSVDNKYAPCINVNDLRSSCKDKDSTGTFDAGIMLYSAREVKLNALDCPGSLGKRGWYQGAWIYGDGTFDFASVDDSLADISTSLRKTHTFRPGDYTFRVNMIEKKTNKIPPNSARTTGRIRILFDGQKLEDFEDRPERDLIEQRLNNAKQVVDPVPAPGPANPRIKGNEGAAIDYSSKIRTMGYETNFAVSAPATPNTAALFFYNSIQTEKKGEFHADVIFEGTEILRPDYLADAPNQIFLTNDAPFGLSRNNTLQKYKTFVAQNLSRDPDIPAGYQIPDNEYRFFPSFKTKACPADPAAFCSTGSARLDAAQGQGIAQFLVLILENATISSNNSVPVVSPANISYTPSVVSDPAALIELINRYMPGLRFDSTTFELKTALGDGQKVYIRGIKRIEVDIVTAIDPTQLIIEKICPSAGNPDLYDVQLQMQVCNEGNAEALGVQLAIFPMAGLSYTGIELSSTTNMGGFTLNTGWLPGADTSYMTPLQSILKGQFGTPIPGAHNSTNEYAYGNNCFDIHFKTQTNWAGVQALQKGKGLVAKVLFLNALKPFEYFNNHTFEADSLSQNDGYKCGPGGGFNLGDCLWWLIIILVLFFIFLWWWKQQQED
jgi:hypothetical protein